MNTCPTCGEKVPDTLDDRAEHSRKHNPSPAQWTDAYLKIQAGKDQAKAKSKEA